MKTLNVDGRGREEARNLLMRLPRNKEFVAHSLSDGRVVMIRSDGTKEGRVGDDVKRDEKRIKNKDFTIHYTNEPRPLNYTDDFLIDILVKARIIERERGSVESKSWIVEMIDAMRNSVELIPVSTIMGNIPAFSQPEILNLPGHSIEFLLACIRWLGIQEDVNYWGYKYKDGKRKGKFEGREKPINALTDLFVKGLPFATIIRRHMLY